jgi:hypothetical protein
MTRAEMPDIRRECTPRARACNREAVWRFEIAGMRASVLRCRIRVPVIRQRATARSDGPDPAGRLGRPPIERRARHLADLLQTPVGEAWLRDQEIALGGDLDESLR